MEEIWKPVKVKGEDFTGYYEVSNLGRIKKLPTWSCDGKRFLKERIMKQTLDKKGYLTVNLQKGSCRFTRIFVHRIVAETFIPNPNNKPLIDHIDRNPSNNDVSNLRWVTHQENMNNMKTNRKIGERRSDLTKTEYATLLYKEWKSKSGNREKVNKRKSEWQKQHRAERNEYMRKWRENKKT